MNMCLYELSALRLYVITLKLTLNTIKQPVERPAIMYLYNKRKI